MAATHVQLNRCTRDNINTRRRLKGHKQMVDTYLNSEIPYPDARAAIELTIGGAMKYSFTVRYGMDDCWVLSNVFPNLS